MKYFMLTYFCSGALSLISNINRSGSKLKTLLLNDNCCSAAIWDCVCSVLWEDSQTASTLQEMSQSKNLDMLIPNRLFLENNQIHPDDVTLFCRSGNNSRAILLCRLKSKYMKEKKSKRSDYEHWKGKDSNLSVHLSNILRRNVIGSDPLMYQSHRESDVFSGVTRSPYLKPPTQCLLSDIQISDFIAYGHLMIDPNVPSLLHDRIKEELTGMYSSEHNPGNNILARIPLLKMILDAPPIQGALCGLLGDNYIIHPHRHSHKDRRIVLPKLGTVTPTGDTVVIGNEIFPTRFFCFTSLSRPRLPPGQRRSSLDHNTTIEWEEIDSEGFVIAFSGLTMSLNGRWRGRRLMLGRDSSFSLTLIFGIAEGPTSPHQIAIW
jgi:hypothetical protein